MEFDLVVDNNVFLFSFARRHSSSKVEVRDAPSNSFSTQYIRQILFLHTIATDMEHYFLSLSVVNNKALLVSFTRRHWSSKVKVRDAPKILFLHTTAIDMRKLFFKGCYTGETICHAITEAISRM